MAHKHMRIIWSEHITQARNALSVFVEKCYNENYFHNDSLMVYLSNRNLISAWRHVSAAHTAIFRPA